MKDLFSGIFIPTLVITIILFVNGCTPGKAQTRQDVDYSDVTYSDVAATGIDDYDFQDSGTVLRQNDDTAQRQERDTAAVRQDSDSSLQQDSTPKQDMKDNKVSYEPTTGPIASEASGDFTGNEKFYQKGFASWYGREFHGKTTASGESFNMNEYSAAHKELPFGTIADVRNINTGRVVRVKINDRGPYRANRIIDLSYAAANELGFIREGETMVGITIVKWGDGARKSASTESAASDYYDRDYNESKPVEEPKGRYSLQAGAFYSQQNANNFKETLKGLTNKPVVIIDDNGMYKVRIQGLVDQNDVRETKRLLESENISSFLVE